MEQSRVAFTAATLMLASLACPDPPAGQDAGNPRDATVVDSALPDTTVHRDTTFPPRDVGPGCGAVPTEGLCNEADQLRWCEDNEVHEADCAALGLVCGEKPSLGGFWCLAGPGQSCHDWPCMEGMICDSRQICLGSLEDAGAEDAAAEDGGARDARSEAGIEDTAPEDA